MSNTSLLGSYGDNSGTGLMFRNRLINGGFDIWQRGTTQASMDTGFYLADRWRVPAVGSTRTSSRQAFTVGQTDVPGNPEFFHRTVVSSVAGAGNLVVQAQRVENVNTLAGQQVTVSFWAKADAPKQIALSFIQYFGTGGSPSATVNTHIAKVSLTTSWQLFTVSVTVPSLSGKTIGTDGNSYLQLTFWFDAGINFNAETGSLGQQSGTFDIAMVQLEAGPTATPFERRPIGVELQMCQRYYYKISGGLLPAPIYDSAGNSVATWHLPVTMRIAPTEDVTITTNLLQYIATNGSTLNTTNIVATYSSVNTFEINANIAGRTTIGFTNLFVLSNTLGLKAEL